MIRVRSPQGAYRRVLRLHSGGQVHDAFADGACSYRKLTTAIHFGARRALTEGYFGGIREGKPTLQVMCSKLTTAIRCRNASRRRALTEGYFGCIREGKFMMQISGTGDPTGRGHGFNYLQEAKRSALEEAVKRQNLAKAGTLTGAFADSQWFRWCRFAIYCDIVRIASCQTVGVNGSR